MKPTPLNPFVVGGAIADSSGQGFFGREKIFDFVRSALNSVHRPPILLIGQRRIGKSSVLRQLPAHLPKEYCCVYFDLQGKETMPLDSVLFGLGRAIADRLKMKRPEREESTEASFDDFLSLVLAELGGNQNRLVLLFDEFDVVDTAVGVENQGASGRFVPYLAELIAKYPGVGFLMVVGRNMEEMSGGTVGAILKDTVHCSIGRLTFAEVKELIEKSSLNVLSFRRSALDRVFQLASGHPFCTQVLCHLIWSEAVARPGRPPHVIESPNVGATLGDAIELGANGMNWIFDGLVDPTHRLVLAAVAQESDPLKGTAADRATIDGALRANSVFLDSVDVDRALRDLTSWDILVRLGAGFTFAVPMIGVWTRNKRPLDRLQSEARLTNPRAWRFYEVGLDSRQRGEVVAAVSNFRSALEANPSFAEAQRALASTLFEHREPVLLGTVIEELERALEFDPSGPRTELLEALTDGMTSTAKVDVIAARLKRIRELDPGGRYESKALRQLSEKARGLAEMPGTAKVAASAYELLGSFEEAANAHTMASRMVNDGYGYMFWIGSVVIFFLIGFLHYPAMPWIRLGVAVLGGFGPLREESRSLPKGLKMSTFLWTTGFTAAAFTWIYFTHWSAPAYILNVLLFFIAINVSPASTKDKDFPEDAKTELSEKLSGKASTVLAVLTGKASKSVSSQP